MSAEVLASTLERYCDRPVVNMTGLSGVYDVVFEMSPEDSQEVGIRAAVNAGVRLLPQALSLLDSGGSPLVVAVEQLGLKLDAPVDVLVVDEARRTPGTTCATTPSPLRRIDRGEPATPAGRARAPEPCLPSIYVDVSPTGVVPGATMRGSGGRYEEDCAGDRTDSGGGEPLGTEGEVDGAANH